MKRALVLAAALIASPAAAKTEAAVLAGGCFWGVEAVFEHVKGVSDVVAGYAGGDKASANYQAIGTGRTGHAEAVRVTYDPAVVTYADLLRIFFSVVHDPTEKKQQGPDVGPQYRSAIFPQDAGQRKVAAAYMAQLGERKAFAKPIATRIESGAFHLAEAYHQDFMRRNPRHPYILAHDAPKIADLKRRYPEWVKD